MKTFSLTVKDGRKVLVMMAGISFEEAHAAILKAAPKIGSAKVAIIECREEVEEAAA